MEEHRFQPTEEMLSHVFWHNTRLSRLHETGRLCRFDVESQIETYDKVQRRGGIITTRESAYRAILLRAIGTENYVDRDEDGRPRV